jgi:hypothetical protein
MFSAPLRLAHPDFKLIDQVYDQFGPIPRLCFDASDIRDFESYERDVFAALCNLTPQKLETLVDECNNLSMGEISPKICLIWRVGSVKDSGNVQISPITDFVGSRIAIHFRNLQRCDQIQLYKRFAAIPSTWGMAGKIFEAYGQQLFQRRISIEYLPMVRLPDLGDEVQTLEHPGSHWHSSHAALDNDQLEAIRQTTLATKSTLVVSPSGTCEYDENDVKARIEPDVYYVPRSANQEAFDSFILHAGYLFVFQFTGGKSHQIKFGLLTFLTQCANIPEQDKWRFIFVIPDVEVLKCPYPQSAEMQNLKLFSSVLAMEKSQWAPPPKLVMMETNKPGWESPLAGRAIPSKRFKEAKVKG